MSGFGGGFLFMGMHAFQIYLKSTEASRELEDVAEKDEGEFSEEKGIATFIIAYGELLLVTTIVFLNIVSLQSLHHQRHLINQLIKYNRILEGL